MLFLDFLFLHHYGAAAVAAACFVLPMQMKLASVIALYLMHFLNVVFLFHCIENVCCINCRFDIRYNLKEKFSTISTYRPQHYY